MEKEIENPFVYAYGHGTDNYENTQKGISLRDELAKAAMLGILTHHGTYALSEEGISNRSYKMADEMLKQRLL